MPCIGTAQTNYLPGYYVTSNGDTVHGFVEYRSSSKMTTRIKFRSAIDAATTKFRASTVRAVVVDNRNFFESHSFSNKKGKTEIGFFKKIIIGRLSLYQYDDQRYFVKKTGDEKMHEISKSTSLRDDNKISTDYAGLGILKILTKDCPSLEDGFLVIQYKGHPDYRKMVNTYNECFNEPHTDVEDIRVAAHFDYGIQGSLNMTKLDFENVAALADADFGNRLSGTGGVFLSIFLPRLGDNVRLIWEPAFGHANRYAYIEQPGRSQDVYLRYTYIKSPVLVRYFKGPLFFDIGVNNFFILKQNGSWRVEDVFPNAILTSNGGDYKLKSQVLGGAIGIGAKLDLGGMPLYTSFRISSIFPVGLNAYEQPKVQAIDLNVALQLNRR